MQATAAKPTIQQREQNESARTRALVRFNGLTFHGITAASFLETAAPQHANRLMGAFGACPDVRLWLEQVWWPQRAELGRQLRQYVEATWPEFDWQAAYQEFCEDYRPRSGLESLGGGSVREALGLCVTAAQAAVFYRALANSADDPALREAARGAAHAHAAYFDVFRALFERCKRDERVGFADCLRTVAAICRSARDHDVALAFQALGRNWNGTPIVPELAYPGFRERMARLIQRHAALGLVERLLFRPWLVPDRATAAPQPPAARPDRWSLLAPQPA